MVQYKTIITTIEDYVAKCDNYPKAIALKGFNRDDYQEEIKGKYPFDPGELETKQRNLQKNVKYDGVDLAVVRLYNINAFSVLQKYLNGDDSWMDEADPMESGGYGVHGFYEGWLVGEKGVGRVNLNMDEYAEALHNVCEKSPPLEQNTVFYRYGRIPNDVLEGGHGRFKGFTGTFYGEESYDANIDQLTQWADGDNRYKLKIYAPKGTKGVTLTHECGAENPYQNEFLIDKGQRFIVLSRNDDTKEAEILLY